MKNENIFAFWRYSLLVAVTSGVLAYFNVPTAMYLYGRIWSVGNEYIVPVVMSLLKQNQFVQVVVFGSVSAYICVLFNTFYRMFILPLFTGMQCSIIIHNMDPNFNAVMDFISDRLLQNIAGSQYSLQANTKLKENKTRKEWMQEWLRGDKQEPAELVYRPDNDQVIHTITYKGVKIYVERAKSTPLMGRDKPFTPESLKLTTWGSDNTVLKTLMGDAVLAACQQLREGTVSIYTLSSGWCSGWELALTKAARPKDSVILDMQDMDMLLDDARNFLKSGKWYVDMGIPYRRGYMLYGPPGCGKTSFAQVLAGELQLDICILNLTHAGLTDDAIAEYLRDAPQNSIIVLEDVDAIFVERTAAAKDDNKRGNTSVSFSGLLNALDGVASQEGRLLFMTTNHIEKLDPALIRPGRCDVQLQLKLASKNQMERMFLRFYPGEAALAKAFAGSLPANELSMAALQGYFLKCSGSPQACVDQTSDLLHATRPTPVTTKSVYEHLKRVGLERYAPVLEFHGITTDQDLTALKLDDVMKFSVELQFDSAAQRAFTQLLDSDNKHFMAESYTLAEVALIRETFLAAYADTSDECLIKTVCSPLLRHHSHNSIDVYDDFAEESGGSGELIPLTESDTPLSNTPLTEATNDESPLDALRLYTHNASTPKLGTDKDKDLTPEVPHSARSGENSETSDSLELIEPTSLSADKLRELSKAFCSALSKSGKGIVSLYNLRRLIDAHPHRPIQCVKAAENFTQPRTVAEKVVKHLDLYAFLKRLGLAGQIHQFIAGEVSHLSTLLDHKGSVAEVCDNAKRTFKVNAECALRLAEVITKTTSASGNLVNFGLHPRSRIMGVFQLFYTAGVRAFPLYTDSTLPAEDGASAEESNTDAADDATASTTADNAVTNSAGAASSAVGVSATSSSTTLDAAAASTAGASGAAPSAASPVVTPLKIDAPVPVPPVPAPVSAALLEKLSYKFGLLVTDAHGQAVVSILEVLDHLRKYPTDPLAAVSSAVAELISPPYPAAPAVAPPVVAPPEWVDEWLKAAPGTDITNYAAKFKDQGFATKEDFLVGPVFTMAELETNIGVNVLAHRRRIIELHAQLHKAEGKGGVGCSATVPAATGEGAGQSSIVYDDC